MTKALRFLAAVLVALPVFVQAQMQRVHTQAELDQMLAPIALYPDALLSQILMAATYPLEVVQAARWSRARPGLEGEAAVRAAQNEDWDPSVKSLVAFPQVLQRMDERLDWTRSLGDAFLAQEPQVMDQVQQLRQRAQAAGNLRSDPRIHVEQQGQTIVVQPASPQVVYVPYYDPMVVYGPWWWPAYQPVVWAPWPGYVRPYQPGLSVGFWWGGPVSLSLNFFFGDFDWHHRHVRVAHAGNHYYRPAARLYVADRGRWQHDPVHRRGVEYRAPEVRQRFASAPAVRREVLREERRDERRLERRTDRQPAQVESRQTRAPVQTQTQSPARVQVQRPAPAVTERRVNRREERRDAQREERRDERQAVRTQVQPRPAARPQPQPVARPQPQLRQAEQRKSMPAAQAPQTPRAERQAERQERREQRQERREDRGNRAG